jgi:type II secretory pathway component PulC
MRERRLLSWMVVFLMVVPACRSRENEEAETQKTAEVQAAAKATVAAVSEPTSPPPTATVEPSPTMEPSPEPTSTPAEEQTSDAISDLQLLGIVRAGTPSAVIAYGGQQEIFRKGDSVFDHGTVREVRNDSVVLRVGEKDVQLKLAEEAPPAAEAPPPAEEVSALTAPPAPPPASEPLPRAEARAALKNFSSVLETADAKRVAVGGGHGVQLGTVDASSFLAKLGLRAGDVLQKINGTSIEDIEHVPDLSGDAEGKQLEIRFTRDDVGLTVSRPIQ